jgi:glycosyltransferase involved in cell wall biosynthesis
MRLGVNDPRTDFRVGQQASIVRSKKISLLTNMVPPYRVTLFSAMASSPEVAVLRVLVCTKREADREWNTLESTDFVQKLMAGITLNLRRGQDGLRILHLRFGVFWELVRHRPDALVIGDASWTSFLGAAACRVYRIPYVIWNEITTASDISEGLAARLRRWMYRGADGFVTSGVMARDYLLANDVAAESISIVHNTVDNAFYQAQLARYAPVRAQLRHDLGISEEAFCFIFVGQLISRKRVMETLECVARAGLIRPMHLLIAGSGPLEAQMKARANDLGFNAITFCGFTDPERLSELYVASDALILLSSDEPWGMVVNEILLFKKGYVATTEVGAAVEMADGETARCISFEQVEAEVLANYADDCSAYSCPPNKRPTTPADAARTFVLAIQQALDA